MLNEDFNLDTPEGFNRKPIERPIIEATGLPDGDDAGYRDVPVADDGEPMVALSEEDGLLLRPIYDGIDPIDGQRNESNILPGGVEGKMLVRESMAAGLRSFAAYLQNRYGDSVKPIVVDAFRSYQRQAAGHAGLLVKALGSNKRPSAEEMFRAGQKADATFSYVRLDQRASEVSTFLNDVKTSTDLAKDLQSLATALGIPFDQVLEEYATFCVNLNVRQQLGLDRDVENPYNSDKGGDLNFENNAHAGGGAVDMFLGVNGQIASTLAPYDFMGPWAAKEILEDDARFDLYVEEARRNPELRTFLQRLGMTPETLTLEDWQFAKEANRVLHHVTAVMGATYYSASNPEEGGENWHVQFPNRQRSPVTGEVVYESSSASSYPNSGNPGQALLRMPKGKAVAVWGGTQAHQQLGIV